MKNNTIQITTNTYLADSYLRYAMIQAIETASLEEYNLKNPNMFLPIYKENRGKYNANNVSIILLVVSFLEAKINEFFCDAANGTLKPNNDSEEELITKLTACWNNNFPRTAAYSIIDKYKIGLEVGKNIKLDMGKLPTQDILLLTKLRNALVHHESETVTTTFTRDYFNSPKSSSKQSLEKKLKNKFRLNPFVAIGNPFFPDKCLSLGCSCWAIVRAVEFIEMYFNKIGIDSYIKKMNYMIKKGRYPQVLEIHNELKKFNYNGRRIQ